MEKNDTQYRQGQSLVDFTASVKSLETRSERAYKRVKVLGRLLVILVFLLITIAGYFYSLNSRYGSELVNEYRWRTESQIERVRESMEQVLDEESLHRALEKKGVAMAELAFPSNSESETVANSLKNLNEITELLNKVNAPSIAIPERASIAIQPDTSFANSFSTIAFSIAIIGFAVLLIQIIVQFMRYYARLAELYEAQADALRASRGDPKVAYEFVQNFTPAAVELGKTPSTVYEKALEAVSNISKK